MTKPIATLRQDYTETTYSLITVFQDKTIEWKVKLTTREFTLDGMSRSLERTLANGDYASYLPNPIERFMNDTRTKLGGKGEIWIDPAYAPKVNPAAEPTPGIVH